MISAQNASVHVRHSFAASAQAVFDAWLDPELLGMWMFHPTIQNEEVINIEIDGKKGGAFRFSVRRDGRVHEYTGTYLDLRRPEQLVFTWISETEPRNTVVSVTIVQTGSGCEVNVVHELGEVADEMIRRVETRWQAELGALSTTLN